MHRGLNAWIVPFSDLTRRTFPSSIPSMATSSFEGMSLREGRLSFRYGILDGDERFR